MLLLEFIGEYVAAFTTNNCLFVDVDPFGWFERIFDVFVYREFGRHFCFFFLLCGVLCVYVVVVVLSAARCSSQECVYATITVFSL